MAPPHMSVDIGETLATAATLARSGNYHAAEAMLSELAPPTQMRADVVDLRARIRAQQGDLVQAQALWEQAVSLESSNGAYLAALQRVRRTARAYSLPLMNGLRFTLVLLVGGAVVTVLALGLLDLRRQWTLVQRQQIQTLAQQGEDLTQQGQILAQQAALKVAVTGSAAELGRLGADNVQKSRAIEASLQTLQTAQGTVR